jgi:hypothetical protein
LLWASSLAVLLRANSNILENSSSIT